MVAGAGSSCLSSRLQIFLLLCDEKLYFTAETGCPPVVSLLLQSAGLTIKWRKCSILLVVLGTASNGTNWICSYCFLFGEDVMPQFPGRAKCLTSPGSIRFMKMNRLTMILNQFHCLTVHWGSQFQSWTRSFFKLSTVYSDCSLSAWSGLLSNYIYFFQHSKQKESAVNCIGIETVICLSEIVDFNMLWTKTEWKLSLQNLWSRSKTLRYINVSIILLLCTVILIVKISNYLSGGDIFFMQVERKEVYKNTAQFCLFQDSNSKEKCINQKKKKIVLLKRLSGELCLSVPHQLVCRGPLNFQSLLYVLLVIHTFAAEHPSHTPFLSPKPSLLSPPPPGGLSAGQPNSQLSGAAVGPPPAAAPVGGHLPGSHLAELWASPLVWSSGQRSREALHPAVRPHSRGERSTESTLKMNKKMKSVRNVLHTCSDCLPGVC